MFNVRGSTFNVVPAPEGNLERPRRGLNLEHKKTLSSIKTPKHPLFFDRFA
jgi:hypothetical protein